MTHKAQLRFVGMEKKKLQKIVAKLEELNAKIHCSTKFSPNESRLTISSKGLNGKLHIDKVKNFILENWGEYCYSTQKETLEEIVVKGLTSKKLIVTTAESCTGGLLAGRIVGASGASQVFEQGFITYSNKAKRKLLFVPKDTLKEFGAVSPQTALDMAVGAALVAKADVALAVTGIAGPEGGTPDKPVGLVYISCYYRDNVQVEEHFFKGDRKQVRALTVSCALDLLRRTVLG